MKNVKLRLKLRRIDNVIFGWIAYQDESLRRSTAYPTDILSSYYSMPSFERTFAIRSYGSPHLCENVLYIRGENRTLDNAPFAYAYQNRVEAKVVYNVIINLVAQINQSSGSEEEIFQQLPDMKTIE